MTDADTIRQRLEDYKRQDVSQQRNELVKRWREEHPEAAKEQSSVLKPLIRDKEYRKSSPSGPDEFWYNDTYNVVAAREALRKAGIDA